MTREAEWGIAVIVVMVVVGLLFWTLLSGVNARIDRSVKEAVKEQCK